MRGLEHKIKTLGEAVKHKDAEIAELKTESECARLSASLCSHHVYSKDRTIQTQLEQEVKMAKAQRSNRPDPVGIMKPDPKQDEVVELYERLTNFIVLSVKRGKFRLFNLPETTFRCIYTHIDDPLGDPSPENDDRMSFSRISCAALMFAHRYQL